VGCGNGRFGRFLNGELELSFDYFGIDYDMGLLLEARRGIGADGSNRRWFARADVVVDGLQAFTSGWRVDLVAALGLLHHVPSFERRQHLVRELLASLAPGGLLALSFWQFGDLSRFRERLIPWREYNRWSADPISQVDLEERDMLLAWGPDRGVSGGEERDALSARYCHFTDPPEAARLVSPLGCQVVETYRSDGETGDLNLYYLLRSTL
jgi:SAM-dependent methyltransferase